MRRIRVLEVLGSLGRGGTEQVMYDILSRLDGNRFDIEAWSIVTDWDETERRRFEESGIRTGAIVMDKPTRWQLLVRSYHRIRGQRPDIVHSHGWVANLWVRAAAILARVPIVMTYEHNPSVESWRRRTLWNLLNLRTYGNVCVSEVLGEYRRRKYPRYADKVVTIVNGIALERFSMVTPEGTQEAKKSLGLVVDQPVIGIVGRLVGWKRHDLFIKAAAIILRTTPGAQFVIIGSGPEEVNLRRLADELGVAGHLRFMGWLDDMEKAYQAMDIVIMTSQGEGLSIVSIEAIACQKPVVAVKTDPAYLQVITDDCGVFVAPSAESVANGIQQLLDNPNLAQQMGMSGRKRAEEKFDIVRAAKELQSLYEKAVDSKRIKLQ